MPNALDGHYDVVITNRDDARPYVIKARAKRLDINNHPSDSVFFHERYLPLTNSTEFVLDIDGQYTFEYLADDEDEGPRHPVLVSRSASVELPDATAAAIEQVRKIIGAPSTAHIKLPPPSAVTGISYGSQLVINSGGMQAHQITLQSPRPSIVTFEWTEEV